MLLVLVLVVWACLVFTAVWNSACLTNSQMRARHANLLQAHTQVKQGQMCNFYLDEDTTASKIRTAVFSVLDTRGYLATKPARTLATNWRDGKSGVKSLGIDFANLAIVNRPNGYPLHTTLCYEDGSDYLTCSSLLNQVPKKDGLAAKYKADWLVEDNVPLWDGTVAVMGNWVAMGVTPDDISIEEGQDENGEPKHRNVAQGLHVSVLYISGGKGAVGESGAFVAAVATAIKAEGLAKKAILYDKVKTAPRCAAI